MITPIGFLLEFVEHTDCCFSLYHIRQRDHHLTVKAPGSQKRRVQHIGPVGSSTRLVDIVTSLNDQGQNTRNGKPWTPTQVKRLITDYRGSFTKSNNKVSAATRRFIEAIGWKKVTHRTVCHLHRNLKRW